MNHQKSIIDLNQLVLTLQHNGVYKIPIPSKRDPEWKAILQFSSIRSEQSMTKLTVDSNQSRKENDNSIVPLAMKTSPILTEISQSLTTIRQNRPIIPCILSYSFSLNFTSCSWAYKKHELFFASFQAILIELIVRNYAIKQAKVNVGCQQMKLSNFFKH